MVGTGVARAAGGGGTRLDGPPGVGVNPPRPGGVYPPAPGGLTPTPGGPSTPVTPPPGARATPLPTTAYQGMAVVRGTTVVVRVGALQDSVDQAVFDQLFRDAVRKVEKAA